MSVEITDIRLLLPALVSFTQDDKELSVFVYIDQLKKDVVLPDTTDIIDTDEFKKAFLTYYKSKNRDIKVPSLPSDVMKKVDPNQFKV